MPISEDDLISKQRSLCSNALQSLKKKLGKSFDIAKYSQQLEIDCASTIKQLIKMNRYARYFEHHINQCIIIAHFVNNFSIELDKKKALELANQERLLREKFAEQATGNNYHIHPNFSF